MSPYVGTIVGAPQLKGNYAFIQPDGTSKNIERHFIHISQCIDFTQFEDGMRVQYEVMEIPDSRPMAIDCRVLQRRAAAGRRGRSSSIGGTVTPARTRDIIKYPRLCQSQRAGGPRPDQIMIAATETVLIIVINTTTSQPAQNSVCHETSLTVRLINSLNQV
eukprot:g78303.t1